MYNVHGVCAWPDLNVERGTGMVRVKISVALIIGRCGGMIIQGVLGVTPLSHLSQFTALQLGICGREHAYERMAWRDI